MVNSLKKRHNLELKHIFKKFTKTMNTYLILYMVVFSYEILLPQLKTLYAKFIDSRCLDLITIKRI